MIIDCISDLHGELPTLEGGDMLIIAGDMTGSDKVIQWKNFFDWFEDQDYKKKVFIGGNHDNYLTACLSSSKAEDMGLREELWYDYLCDTGTEYEGIKIWGSPWTKTFKGINPHCTAFTCASDEEICQKWHLIPENIDILVTHSPPYFVLDQNKHGEHCGSTSLHNELMRIKPKFHIFGHIHENGGKKMILKTPGHDITCINASIMNEYYDPVNNPVRIHI